MDSKNHAQTYSLENMSIPELESLLQQYFLVSEDDSSDAEYMMKITEVILQKEKEAGIAEPSNVDEAWERFQNFYMEDNSKEGGMNEDAAIEEKAAPAVVTTVPAKHTRRTIRRVILVAAIVAVLLAMSVVPVAGHRNVFQMIATWTEEQFTFRPEDAAQNGDKPSGGLVSRGIAPKEFRSAGIDKSKDYETLEEALADYGITMTVFPETLPEGFELQKLHVSESSKGDVLFHAHYYCAANEQNLIYGLIKHSQLRSGIYEKTAADMETYTAPNGLAFYLFSNINDEVAVCYFDDLEISISTNSDRAELKQILDKISN